MINMTNALRVLDDTRGLMKELHGKELDERDAIPSQSRGAARKERAQMSQDLQFMATRLELAASLVRIEYWHARGEIDPLRPDRKD